MNARLLPVVLSLWMLPVVSGCASDGLARQSIFGDLKNIGKIVVGETTLTSAKESYGGSVKSYSSSDGRFNSLCLTSNYKGKRILISLISSALGGWETITEYEVSFENEQRVSDCGNYNFGLQTDLPIFRKLNEVTSLYGRPNKTEKNSIEYTAMYQKEEDGIQYTIYTGLTVFYGADLVVEKFGFFETQSN